MASFWSFFSSKGKGGQQTFKPKSKQDFVKKTVSQSVFGHETTFSYADFHDLKSNGYYDRFLAGQLHLPTGKVVCADPLYRELGLPQNWAIAKGDYPVYLYIGLEDDFAGRVAYAELSVKDEIPAYWEMSLIPEDLLADDVEKRLNGLYPVENGLGCFADFETFKIYEEEIQDFYKKDNNANFYLDVLGPYFKANKDVPQSSRGEDWVNYKLEKANGNIIMFGSGYGDGLYPRYVGCDKNGNVVKFITDFIQLADSEDDS